MPPCRAILTTGISTTNHNTTLHNYQQPESTFQTACNLYSPITNTSSSNMKVSSFLFFASFALAAPSALQARQERTVVGTIFDAINTLETATNKNIDEISMFDLLPPFHSLERGACKLTRNQLS